MSAQIQIIYFSLSPYLAHCFSSCSVTLLLWIIWLWFCFYLKITMFGNPSINYNNNEAIEVFNGICYSFAINPEDNQPSGTCNFSAISTKKLIFNDILSNSVAAIALLLALYSPKLWFIDPVGAICISLYIV